MHNSRLFALVGAGIGIMGLFLKALTTAGEGLLPTLSQTDSGFPNGIPTIWGGLATWAQIVLVLVIGAIITLSLRPRHEDPLDRTSGGHRRGARHRNARLCRDRVGGRIQ